MSLLAKILGKGQAGATKGQLLGFSYHNKFSDYLPWVAYDEETKIYYNTDDSQGYIWECTPLVFSSEKVLHVSEALSRLQIPPFSVLQFLLHADSHIDPYLQAFKGMRDTADPLVNDAIDSYCNFLRDCSKGIPQLSNIPLRRYRLLVSLKIPSGAKVKMEDIRTLVQETLDGMHIGPRHMEPPDLLEWGRRLFNGSVSDAIDGSGQRIASLYNDHLPLGKQVILGGTLIDVSDDHMEIGGKVWCSMTPKAYPVEVDPLQTKELFGGIWGVRSENEQHRTPFLYALNIIFDNLKHHLRTKCDMVLMQSAAGSFARSLRRKQEEFTWGIDKIDQGEVFARVMPVMWFIGDSYAEADDARKCAKRIWEGNGYLIQEDRKILTSLFLSSLPMGMRANAHNLNMLERDTIADANAIVNILPIQGDFSGSNEPVLLMQGRSGQIVPLSIFSKMANNYNGFVAASSGAGKSFFVNQLAFAHYSVNTIMRIIDIGGSYKRMTHIFDGRYLDFDNASNVCLNPFSNIVDPEEDIPAISAIIMQMVYSASDEPDVPEVEHSIAKDAVLWAHAMKGERATVDDVYEYLVRFPEYLGDHKRATPEIIIHAHKMAYNMTEFTSHGQYGRYFIGDANFNIANDKFLLLELESLKAKKDLFKVVTLLVLDAVTRDLYLSDRTSRRMVIFDEAWQFLSGAGGNVMMREIIESGFRRARKYGGSFIIITQSLLDRQLFGSIGDIIWNNADYKFLLESKDYEKAVAEKLINYDRFTIELLNSVQKNKTKYSEIFVDTPYGAGIVRLAVDPFSYYLYTSDAGEMAEMEQMVAGGMTYREAIHEMVRKYRS